ncbi:MAG: PDDEXK nuclease domain-containing protein [Prevotellaceae bacterium]|jgi:predicted nuclease of restriction endonuclease-like (RecB) superfamily|nr:PDDEXK nuclease domain-containing protein [Prevotellaceae bacterium]
MNKISKQNSYIADIKHILALARQRAYSAINSAMVEAYWLIGRRIVEEEQQGKERAEYGGYVVKTVSQELTAEFGKGFSERSVFQFRQFYQMFPENEIWQEPLAELESADEIRRTPFAELESADEIVREPLAQLQKSENKQVEIVRTPFAQFKNIEFSSYLSRLNWTQIQRIMRVSNPDARAYYIKETAENMWSSTTLDRNISTLYYQRLLSSQNKEPVIAEMQEKTKGFQQNKLDFIKNPAVLEFLGLPNNKSYTETELEQAIIDDMQRFLLELGKGFAFIERQQLVRTETQDFYIDLVFYNYILRCFVILELKAYKIMHQDIGQLDMYVRMYDDLKRREGDNPTIGILLCTETDKTMAQYSVLNDNQQLFATKYMEYLPTEEELRQEIERQKEIFQLQQKGK